MHLVLSYSIIFACVCRHFRIWIFLGQYNFLFYMEICTDCSHFDWLFCFFVIFFFVVHIFTFRLHCNGFWLFLCDLKLIEVFFSSNDCSHSIGLYHFHCSAPLDWKRGKNWFSYFFFELNLKCKFLWKTKIIYVFVCEYLRLRHSPYSTNDRFVNCFTPFSLYFSITVKSFFHTKLIKYLMLFVRIPLRLFALTKKKHSKISNKRKKLCGKSECERNKFEQNPESCLV